MPDGPRIKAWYAIGSFQESGSFAVLLLGEDMNQVDMIVHPDYERQGIGSQIMQNLQNAIQPRTSLVAFVV